MTETSFGALVEMLQALESLQIPSRGQCETWLRSSQPCSTSNCFDLARTRTIKSDSSGGPWFPFPGSTCRHRFQQPRTSSFKNCDGRAQKMSRMRQTSLARRLSLWIGPTSVAGPTIMERPIYLKSCEPKRMTNSYATPHALALCGSL